MRDVRFSWNIEYEGLLVTGAEVELGINCVSLDVDSNCDIVTGDQQRNMKYASQKCGN